MVPLSWLVQYYWHVQNGSMLNAILEGAVIGVGVVYFWRLFA